jgi:uncharacterized protein YoxC
MRSLPLATAALGFVLFATGCSSVDKAQACIDGSKVIADTISQVGGLVNDPKQMEKALNDGAAKLGDVADKAGNTTVNQALKDLSDSIGKLNVSDANEAALAAARVAKDGAATAQKIAHECT